MKVLFMGTPAFAAASLQALLDAGHQVVGVVTRPDAPAGRGLKERVSRVKALAESRGLSLFQPVKLRDPDLADRLSRLDPDLLAVVAFGRILPAPLLELAPLGAVNVHASLLPKLRGAAPIPWAIARGEPVTGVTTMRMIEALDAGEILLQVETPIGDEETAGELEQRLAALGGRLLVETLAGLAAGSIVPRPQDPSRATWAPVLRKEDGEIDWSLSAVEIARRVRAFDPWPVARTRAAPPSRRRLLIWRASPAGVAAPCESPGTVIGLQAGAAGEAGVLVACGEGERLLLAQVQPEAGRRMAAAEALSGRHLKVGDRLGGE